MTVKLGASQGKSWISVKDHNGRLLFDGLLLEGESKTFQDKERIDLVLGNAGAIELFVNGKKLQDRFEPGQVERLTYTKGDPEAGFDPAPPHPIDGRPASCRAPVGVPEHRARLLRGVTGGGQATLHGGTAAGTK